MQSIDLIETDTYGTNLVSEKKRKNLVGKKKEIKCNNIIKRYKK